MNELIDRTYTHDHWRNTTYRLADGREVQVAVPQRVWLDANGDPAKFDYDEEAEASMLASLGGGSGRGIPT